MTRWDQPYLVLTICRLLRTIECGDVTSKALAGEWATKRMPEWSTAVRRALDDRPDPWARVHQIADPLDAETTRAFLSDIERRFLTRDATARAAGPNGVTVSHVSELKPAPARH